MSRRLLVLPFGDPDPAETAKRDVELVAAWQPGVVGVVGWRESGWEALRLAAAHPEIERLVLVQAPQLEDDVPPVAAKTLILEGNGRQAQWWKRQLGANARFEVRPGTDEDDLRTLLWPRILSFLAPRAFAAK